MLTSRELRQRVGQFRKDFALNRITCYELYGAIEKQGYTIIEYNGIFNDENVTSLVEALNIQENIARSKGFTYADGNYRLVFVHEGLSEAEKTIVLAHEAGHIYCGHMSSVPIIGNDVMEEFEANEFAHYLLRPGGAARLKQAAFQHKKKLIGGVAALSLVTGGVSVYNVVNNPNDYYGEYYVTSSGSKYHIKDCIYIREKTNIRRLTQEELESSEYEPCKVCLP